MLTAAPAPRAILDRTPPPTRLEGFEPGSGVVRGDPGVSELFSLPRARPVLSAIPVALGHKTGFYRPARAAGAGRVACARGGASSTPSGTFEYWQQRARRRNGGDRRRRERSPSRSAPNAPGGTGWRAASSSCARTRRRPSRTPAARAQASIWSSAIRRSSRPRAPRGTARSAPQVARFGAWQCRAVGRAACSSSAPAPAPSASTISSGPRARRARGALPGRRLRPALPGRRSPRPGELPRGPLPEGPHRARRGAVGVRPLADLDARDGDGVRRLAGVSSISTTLSPITARSARPRSALFRLREAGLRLVACTGGARGVGRGWRGRWPGRRRRRRERRRRLCGLALRALDLRWREAHRRRRRPPPAERRARRRACSTWPARSWRASPGRAGRRQRRCQAHRRRSMSASTGGSSPTTKPRHRCAGARAGVRTLANSSIHLGNLDARGIDKASGTEPRARRPFSTRTQPSSIAPRVRGRQRERRGGVRGVHGHLGVQNVIAHARGFPRCRHATSPCADGLGCRHRLAYRRDLVARGEARAGRVPRVATGLLLAPRSHDDTPVPALAIARDRDAHPPSQPRRHC